MEKLQRFSIRKLSIGAVSCIIGTVTFLGYANNVQAAEKPQTVETAKAETEIQSEKAQESKPNEEAKGDTQNEAVDKDAARSQVNNAAVVNASDQSKSVSDQSKLEDSSAVASTSERNQLQTSQSADTTDVQPASDKVESASNNSNALENDVSAASGSTVLSKQPANAAQTKLVRRPVMRLAAAASTDSNELIVGKDVTISDFSVTTANGRNEFENSHANIKFTMHADDPSALVGKRLTIQLGKIWDGFYASQNQGANPTTISYRGQVIGNLNYGHPFKFVYITFNNHVKDYTSINLQSDLVEAGDSQNSSLYQTDLYTPTQAKDGQTYYLTDDITIGQQKYSSNLPSTIHYRKLGSESISSVTNLTTTSYAQNDSKLYAGTFYKTPDGIYYSRSGYLSGSNLYYTKSWQPGHLEGLRLFVGGDVITDHTQSYTATFDIDQTKLSPDLYSKLISHDSYYLNKYYFDNENLLPNTSDVYSDYSQTYPSTATADATVTKNGVIFNKLNGQSLVTQEFSVDNGHMDNSHATYSGYTNYISQNGCLYITPTLFKQLQAVAESDQNLTEALNTVTTTGRTAEIKLANPIDTGVKATIKTSDGKTKEVPLLIDTIEYPIRTASTAPKGSILVSAQGKTAKVYHPGDQNIPAVVDQSQLTKIITRTINVHEPGKSVTTTKQTVTLTQSVSVVDGKDVTYNGDWKIQGDSQWASYDVPSVPGYTASQSQIAKETVTGETKDQTVNITYTANPQTTTVVYQSEDGTSVHTTTVNGHTGQTVKVSNEVPVGWHVVNGTVPSEITFGPNGAPKTVVTIAHSHVTVTSDAPKTTSDKLPDNPDKAYPAGVSHDDLNKTVTRTIKTTTPDGQTKTIEQTAKLTRTADVDEVTGEVKYSNWTTGEWDKYDVPSVPGYTASQSSVAQQEVTDATKDQTVNVTYTANEHQISIEYVDNATGHVVKTDNMSGKTGQTVSITPHIPDGWELVSGQSVPSEVTLGADGAPATVIKVQPQERSVAIKFVDDQSDEQPVDKVITVTGRDGGTVDLNLTVPDKYKLADGQQLPTTYTFANGSGDVTIHLAHKVVQREATVDVQIELTTIVDSGVDDDGNFTFAVTQTHWKQLDDEIKNSKNPDSDKVWPSVKIGTLTGHVDYDLVDNKVVSFNDDWTSLNSGSQTYQMSDGTEVVNGVLISSNDLWGKSFKEQLLKYYPDADVDPDYVNRPWHGYLSVNATNEIDPSDFTGNDLQLGLVGNEPNALAKAIGDQAATAVKTANKTIDSNWLKGKFDMQQFIEQNGQLHADAFMPLVGAYIPYVEKTATRTINVTTPDGKTTTVKQTATLAKQVEFGKDAHPAWTTSEWVNYDVPVIPGYTASQSSVAKETVTGTTEDQTVNITYTANNGTQTIFYQDEDGSKVSKQVISGKTDEKVKVTSDVPDGYVLKGEVPSEVIIKPDDTPITVTVEHGKSHVTPDKPVNKGDLIPDTKDKHYPEGLTHNDLNKTVTREITITDPTGKKTTTTQTVTFTRGATVDEVTNKVTYDDWSENGKHTFDKVDVPTAQGYTASDEVPSIVVTPETQLSKVDIGYSPDVQYMTITYIDDTTGKKLHTDNPNGVSDQDAKYTTSDTIKKYEDQHYKLVSDSTNGKDLIFDHDDKTNQTYEVHFKHGSHAISDKRTITETITYKMSDGSTAPNKVEKQIKFNRVGKRDDVTGTDTWNAWQPNKQSFSAVSTPDVTGYTPDIKSVEAKTVTAGDKDIAVTITYSPDQQKAKVVFIDDTTKKTLDTHNLTGVTNSHEKYSPSEEIEKFIHDNYVFVSSDYPEKGFTYDNDDSKDQVFEIHFKEIPTESDTPIAPDNNGDNGGSNGTPTDSDEPEKDNGGSDTDKSNHKTPVKRHDNNKHHGTKKTNKQKNANKNYQSTKTTNIPKTSKTAKLNSNRFAQPKLEKAKESTNNVNRIKHDALPQTGEKRSGLMAMLGLVISGLVMIGAMKSKRRKDN